MPTAKYMAAMYRRMEQEAFAAKNWAEAKRCKDNATHWERIAYGYSI